MPRRGPARIGEVARAARCAFWLAFGLLNSGEPARGGGWVDRAQRLLDGRKLKCVEQGYLRYAAALRSVFSGDVDGVRALAAHVTGAVLVAEGDPQNALVPLRRALTAWLELEATNEAARVRVLIARCCRALGDTEGADMELAAARTIFARLGAAPDIARLDLVPAVSDRRLPGGLTAREAEVLSLVAKGMTNRDIAGDLVISEKTVASHLSHIFTKLGLSSRAAATAYAYEHGLV